VSVELSLSGRRVLVTGATGFIGSHLCERLVVEGAQVHAVSRRTIDGSGEGIRWWRCDLVNLDSVRELIRLVNPDIVFHLSGHVSAAPEIANVLPTFHGLLASTVNLLTTLTSESRCSRIILTGSLTEPPPGSVDTPPSSPYAAAKWAGLAYGRMFHSLYGAPVVMTRPYMVYGPRQHKSKVLPYTISSLARGIPPSLASGTWSADWIYISDVIEGLIRAATFGDVLGCTIDFGSGVLTPIKEVVGRIVTLMRSPLDPMYGAQPDRTSEVIRAADVKSTHARLGWNPAVSLDQGLSMTIQWARDQMR
jgi:UDP-glucose 4-epimerase